MSLKTSMETRCKIWIWLACFLALNQSGIAQVSIDEVKLDSLTTLYPKLNDELKLSVNEVDISDFVNGISQTQGLNIGVSKEVVAFVDHTFSNVKIKDVLLFLMRQYNLDIKTYGEIIFLVPKKPEAQIPIDKYAFVTVGENNHISIDSENEKLIDIVKAVGLKTGQNTIVDQNIRNVEVSLYLKNVSIPIFFEKIASLTGNALKIDSTTNMYNLYKEDVPPKDPDLRQSKTRNSRRDNTGLNEKDFTFEIANGLISVRANDASTQTIIKTVSSALGKDFVLLGDLSKNQSVMDLNGIGYKAFLNFCLAGTQFRYVNIDSTYIIGKDGDLNINSTKVFKFQNRTYENVLDLIPEDLLKGIELKEFSELNGFVINGNVQLITRLTDFLESIDQRVPMVTIDIVIVDYNDSRILSTGISAGFGPDGDAKRSQGKISSGGIDVSLNSKSVNSILSSFDQLGMFNLGKVAPDFYLNLKLLESKGILRTRSTPKITTLNGEEATLSLGETQYYLEVRNDIIGTQNPTVSNSQTYRSVNADLSVRIKPVISSDGQVTMLVNVNQTDFTNKINPSAPPGAVTRRFESIIRVADGEMVILGGLETTSKSKSGSGIPILSRIPIIKHLFSSRDDSFQKSKLNIFIKPRIYY